MADLTWTGSTSGDFSDANNWIVTSTGATPGSPPANSDTLRFDRGSVDVSAGLTTGLTGITMLVLPGYYGNIGTISAALSIACASLTVRGGGSFVKITGNQTVARFYPPGGTTLFCAGGTWTTLEAGLGRDVVVEAAAVVTTLLDVGARYTFEANGTAITLADMNGGVIRECKRAITTLVLGPRSRAHMRDSATVGTVSVFDGAVHTHSSKGNITTAKIYDRGRVSFAAAPANLTVGTMYRFGSGSSDHETIQGVTVTVSSDIRVGGASSQSQSILVPGGGGNPLL